jgi:hypothetical protein
MTPGLRRRCASSRRTTVRLFAHPRASCDTRSTPLLVRHTVELTDVGSDDFAIDPSLRRLSGSDALGEEAGRTNAPPNPPRGSGSDSPGGHRLAPFLGASDLGLETPRSGRPRVQTSSLYPIPRTVEIEAPPSLVQIADVNVDDIDPGSRSYPQTRLRVARESTWPTFRRGLPPGRTLCRELEFALAHLHPSGP